ncbi:MAG: ribosome silencing factor [Rhodospirillaceae bacterium]
MAEIVENTLDGEKAEEIRTIDLQGKSGFANYMVVASGRSARHVGAMAAKLVEALKPHGVRVTLEGQQQCDWVLLDAGDVVVHLFRPEVRAFYDLEKMWTSPSLLVTGTASGTGTAVA